MTSREKYLRQFLRSSCDESIQISAPSDLQFVCSDGSSFAHKFVVMGFLPELKQLLCDLCQNSHEDTKMILPSVNKADVDMAKDFLYMFGDIEPFKQIFWEKRRCEPSMDVQVKADQPLKANLLETKDITEDEKVDVTIEDCLTDDIRFVLTDDNYVVEELVSFNHDQTPENVTTENYQLSK